MRAAERIGGRSRMRVTMRSLAPILTGMILSMIPVADRTWAAGAEPLLANPRSSHEDRGLGYALSYPQNWHIWPHHAGAILSPGTDPRASSCTLLVSPQIGVPEAFELDPSEWTALMRSSVPGYQLIESKRAAFSDTPVTMFFGGYKGPEGAMKIVQAEAVKRNTLYSLECTAPAAFFDKHRSEMEDIASSLRVVGAETEQDTTAQPLIDYRDYSLHLIAAPSAAAPNSGPLQFEIVDDLGERVRNFELVHEKLVHF